MEHSSEHPQETLTVARLYIEPTLKGESGPVGDPIVSDPMHPNGVHLSRDRTHTVREEPTVLSTVSLATHNEF